MGRKHLRAARSALAVCVAGIVQLDPCVAWGGITYSTSSTAKWTFDPNTASTPNSYSLNVNPPPSSAGMPVPSSYQYSKTQTSGSTQSVAKGSIGFIANSTTATFTLAAGTGVTQTDPGNLWTGASSLKVDFDGRFNPTSPSFGPTAMGYVSIAVGGTVGTGGSAQFIAQLNFYNANTMATLRPTVNFNQTFSTVGPFTKTFSSSSLLGAGTVPVGTPVRVKGYFEFRASNEEGPSDMNPLDVDIGGAPPTATWFADASGDWSSATNWAAPAGSEIDDPDGTIPTIPNGVGHRARFASYFTTDRAITLDIPVTIAAMDVSTASNLTVDANVGSGLTFNSEAGDATIQVRDVNGSSVQTLNTPVVLADNLDVVVDGSYVPTESPDPVGGLVFGSSISGTANQGLRKLGEGNAALNAQNTYTGGTTAAGGKLSANVTGSLGTGTVQANDGQLNYNASHAAAMGVIVQATNNAQVDLGIVPDASEHFAIGAHAAVSGSAAELSALDVGPGGNLELSTGAMIAHETFDTDPLLNNPAGLPPSPLFIFGIASDFDGGGGIPLQVTVGSSSGTPWSGFGSDRTARVFGSVGSASLDRVSVAGDADLVVLHETLSFNAQIMNLVPATLAKRGRGTLALNHPSLQYNGPINVAEGRLLANGGLFGVTNLAVQAGAALGGSGIIGGTVNAQSGSVIEPGGEAPTNRIGVLSVGTLILDGATINLDMDLSFDAIQVQSPNALGFGPMNSTINVNDLGNLLPGQYPVLEYNGAPISDSGKLVLGTPNIGNFNLFLVYNALNTSIDLGVLEVTRGTWAVDGNGQWTTFANWSGGVPGGVGHSATFGPVISAPGNIINDVSRTLAALNFDSAQQYTIGGLPITLDTTGEDAQINVLNGLHVVSAPLSLARDLTVNTAVGSGINVPALNSLGRVLTKTGEGTVGFVHVRAGALHVQQGTVVVSPKPSPNTTAGTSVVRSLDVSTGAALDLTNNSLILDYDDVGSLVTAFRTHIQSGKLMTSTPGAQTRLGYGDNAVLGKGTFGGLPVDLTSVLVKFTYGGDTDLDGDVDIADLGELASNWQTNAPWTGGDSDYNGFVGVNDLGILASNWQLGVGNPLGPSLDEALASFGLPSVSVPEPASAALLAVPLTCLSRRRRHPTAA
jgi:autotransporter-associated beta strand protein